MIFKSLNHALFIVNGVVIGDNVWITESMPPETRVMMEMPRLIYK